MKFIIDEEKYIKTGLVNVQKHPTAPLLIYNYSQKCQFSKAWDDITMMCRGLIVNSETREIIARPFKKFFNLEEFTGKGNILPNEVPYVLRKMDGSLGILYWVGDEPMIATRGSFMSDQAQWATKWLKENVDCSKFDRSATYLFEIIYPQNRIVVSYNFSSLVLLDIINIETGKRSMMSYIPENLARVDEISFTSYTALKELNSPNEEGFVLYFPEADMRLKIKFDDYVRLHKVMTGLSEIGIWEMLRDGKDPITPEIPDEMHNWINGVMSELRAKFAEIWGKAQFANQVIGGHGTRKEQAIAIMKDYKPISGIIFSILDGKNLEATRIVWSMIRPKGSHTFKVDTDA